MDSERTASPRDWTLIGRNVRSTRKRERLTQRELARHAGVSLSSVLRVENARPIRLTTLKKITGGLNIVFNSVFQQLPEVPAEDVGIHRSATAKWYAIDDRRPKAEPGQLVKERAERQRLGRIGFVSGFLCGPSVILPQGPGLILLEVYGPLIGPLNAEFYSDAVLYVMQGQITAQIEDREVVLEKDDWVGYKTATLKSYAPCPPWGGKGEPAIALWIGANRVKRTGA
jgi:transcriptional regulator with XRE-family HTH domain